eukprot:11490815-Ditylum_brightwellii.AAC.1
MMRKTGNACDRCIRGLEHMASPEYFEQVQVNRDCVHSAVFREQHRQQMLGINDVEEMREVSASASQWGRNKALELGLAYAKGHVKKNSMCFATI